MYLTHLGLTNYRNYAALELDLAPGVLVFLGENAQGKTNLLESIALLATTRAPRAGSDIELIRWAALQEEGQAVARVAGSARRRHGEVEVEIAIAALRMAIPGNGQGQRTGKRLRVNGVPRRASETVGQVAAVLFTAQDIELLTGAPSLRRRYLDITISQVDAPYLHALQRYSRILLQRNSLLRRLQEGLGRPDQLAFWDQELVREAASIFTTRATALASLAGQAAEFHQSLSDGRESLSITYLPQLPPGLDITCFSLPAAGLRERLLEQIHPRQRQEIAAGASLYGPHRDDVAFAVNGVSVGSYGSRAQQRTAALALRLAEMRYIEAQSGDDPILLLDDILSELDERRRRSVLAVLRADQVLVTATEADRLSAELLASARRYHVEQGRVTGR